MSLYVKSSSESIKKDRQPKMQRGIRQFTEEGKGGKEKKNVLWQIFKETHLKSTGT